MTQPKFYARFARKRNRLPHASEQDASDCVTPGRETSPPIRFRRTRRQPFHAVEIYGEMRVCARTFKWYETALCLSGPVAQCHAPEGLTKLFKHFRIPPGAAPGPAAHRRALQKRPRAAGDRQAAASHEVGIGSHTESNAVDDTLVADAGMRHHINIGEHPGLNVMQLRFAEVSDDPPGTRVDESEDMFAGGRVGALRDGQVGHAGVERSNDVEGGSQTQVTPLP
jgi:hypothetical protein